MKMFRISWASSYLFFICFNLFGKNSSSFIIEVKKDTKLFDKPSARGSVVGQADQGTYLIFLGKSKKGFWVNAQDSVGLSGWLPKDRTDYADIENALLLPKQFKENEEKIQNELKDKDSLKEMADGKGVLNYRISPFFRFYSKPTIGPYSMGLRFDLKIPSPDSLRNAEKINILSFEGGMPSDFKKISDGFSGAFRFGSRTPLFQKLFYGLDYGYAFENKSSFYHHLSIGLSLGLDLSRFDIRTRFGYDFFSGSHATFEVQLGCWF